MEFKVHIHGWTEYYNITGFNKIFNVAGSDNLVRLNGYLYDSNLDKIDQPIEINQWLILSVINTTDLPIYTGYYLAQDLAFDLPFTEPT